MNDVAIALPTEQPDEIQTLAAEVDAKAHELRGKLEARQFELQAELKEVEDLLARLPRPNKPQYGTLTGKVVAYLKEHGATKAADVARGLDATESSVRSLLSKMCANGTAEVASVSETGAKMYSLIDDDA